MDWHSILGELPSFTIKGSGTIVILTGIEQLLKVYENNDFSNFPCSIFNAAKALPDLLSFYGWFI